MGVKSLWTLLTPVGRPVMLETVEGKAMAIDSSIWIYQFQATMRDKDGRALVNAHVLGFLRRISKLLFYGIKPVFVFDGGAPALKRSTLNERRKKKAGAASSHAKLAEKLLAAQLRREALNHAGVAQTSSTTSKGKGKERPIELNEDTVYLEDIDGSVPKTPTKKKVPTPSSSVTKKNKYHDHDPYNLPDVDLQENIIKATRSVVPDPRLATEEELRTFIEDMRPEDFDINSPAFRELPTEVQYEIVGDLRLRSRQTSYARLQKMLKSASTPLDFSKQQIKNLRQRNALTQQLLMTTDTIGSASIAIPIRIASERNKEYVLMKNEGVDGGWILGIKDTGTREKPIVLDHEEEIARANVDDDSDADMEEVEVPLPAVPDPDLRNYQREMALSGVNARNASKSIRPPVSRPINRKTKSLPLFDLDDDDELSQPPRLDEFHDDDDLVAYALQESLDQVNLSMKKSSSTPSKPSASTSHSFGPTRDRDVSSEDDFYEDFVTPNRLQTALSIANAGPNRLQSSPSKPGIVSTLFGKPSLLSSPSKSPHGPVLVPDSDGEMDIAKTNEIRKSHSNAFNAPSQAAKQALEGNLAKTPTFDMAKSSGTVNTTSPTIVSQISEEVPDEELPLENSDSDEDMEEVPVVPLTLPEYVQVAPDIDYASPSVPPNTSDQHMSPPMPMTPPSPSPPHKILVDDSAADEPLFIPISRTTSPSRDISESRPESPPIADDWDAAQEMDAHAEEGEFARFMSQVKGRDLNDVRQEIDEEIKSLNDQRKAAMRDSEDITQQMISQIMMMLRLFGIPYITAPMEAEAQCAELVSLGLVDGVITDDSDVFLFGAQRVFKNMFNQSKTVECFLLSDLSRELGLDRDTLIQLAYLLGSDYTEGLPGVGPVVAMELLKEFPGHNGLYKFRDWWTKVQSGKDNETDNTSKFRKQFKKKFKDLYLASDWPNSVVRDAYYHPAVDSSEEPFKWGLPDLDGLRNFLHQELGWRQSKVDELLLPIIQKMNKRGQVAALNKQGNLNEFFDVTAGIGTYAPRQHQAYASKRLQDVISDFRKRQKCSSTPIQSQDREGGSDSSSASEAAEAPAKKRKKSVSGDGTRRKVRVVNPKIARGGGGNRGRGAGAGRGRQRKGKGKALETSEDQNSNGDEDEGSDAFVGPPVVVDEAVLARNVEFNLRPRPKPRPIRKAVAAAAEIPTVDITDGARSPTVMES